MRKSLKHSTEVEGIANVLCRHYTKLKPDQATLAGLIHNIGVLPILTYAEDTSKLNDPITLERVIDKIHPKVGTKILQSWEFPQELIAVPGNYLNFQRDTGNEKPDYADIVMVANLQSYIGSEHPLTTFDWATVSAFGRLGLDPHIEDTEGEDLSEEMAAAMAMLQ